MRKREDEEHAFSFLRGEWNKNPENLVLIEDSLLKPDSLRTLGISYSMELSNYRIKFNCFIGLVK